MIKKNLIITDVIPKKKFNGKLEKKNINQFYKILEETKDTIDNPHSIYNVLSDNFEFNFFDCWFLISAFDFLAVFILAAK